MATSNENDPLAEPTTELDDIVSSILLSKMNNLSRMNNAADGRWVDAYKTWQTQRILASHDVRDAEGKVVDKIGLDLDKQESLGTRKLIGMSLNILSSLKYGTVMMVDEFDASLHPLLSRAIMGMFNNPAVNTGNGQLIAVTHNTNLLDKALYRRDQIWFVEKDGREESHLTSLAEFRVKNDAAYEKNYLQGRYGAIPFVGDLSALPKVKDDAATIA